MREIKFRAWDKSKKRLTRIGYLISMAGEVAGVSNPENYILMQFTGLKDVNGKDIYEGDIVLPIGKQRGNHTFRHYTKKRVIKWVTIRANRGLARSGFNITDSLYEVIGNIYENPELLST